MTKKHKPRLIVLFVLTLLIVLFFAFFSPESLPVGYLVVPFVLLFIWVYILSSTLYLIFFKKENKPVSAFTAIFLIFVLLLGSLRQLSARDIILSISLLALLGWYANKIFINKE